SECRSNMAVTGDSPPLNLANPSAHGGALFVETNAEAALERTTFNGNLVQGGGSSLGVPTPSPGQSRGGAAFNAGTLRFSECTLEYNQAKGGLGAPPGPGRGGAVAS